LKSQKAGYFPAFWLFSSIAQSLTCYDFRSINFSYYGNLLSKLLFGSQETEVGRRDIYTWKGKLVILKQLSGLF